MSMLWRGMDVSPEPPEDPMWEEAYDYADRELEWMLAKVDAGEIESIQYEGSRQTLAEIHYQYLLQEARENYAAECCPSCNHYIGDDLDLNGNCPHCGIHLKDIPEFDND